MEKYIVIHRFKDINSGKIYEINEEYVEKASDERLAMLSGNDNILGHPVIKLIDENNEIDENVESKIEHPEKRVEERVEVVELRAMKVSELRELAHTRQIKGYRSMKKAELIEALS